MNILVTGANGQLGHEMQLAAMKSKLKKTFGWKVPNLTDSLKKCIIEFNNM